MSELPDLDTGNIGFIGFYNIIDQGNFSGDWTVDEVLDDSNIISYTLYDNGIEGVYSLATGREAGFRVKSDGWFMAYIDRSNSYGTESSSENIRGYWDIARDWTSSSGSSTIATHTLERAIYNLKEQLDNKAGIAYNSSDVGLYNFEYENATNTVCFSANVSRGGDYNSESQQAGFSYTGPTDIKFMAAAGSNSGQDHPSGGSGGNANFEGVTMVSGRAQNKEGVIDIIARGLAPNSGTEYQSKIVANSGDTYAGTGRVSTTVLIIWG